MRMWCLPNWVKRYNLAMSPTIFREGSFRFFFFSREEPRIHVHVSHPDREAKFWISPELALATSTGLLPKQIKETQRLVVVHMKEITHAWHTHFPSWNHKCFKTWLLAAACRRRVVFALYRFPVVSGRNHRTTMRGRVARRKPPFLAIAGHWLSCWVHTQSFRLSIDSLNREPKPALKRDCVKARSLYLGL